MSKLGTLTPIAAVLAVSVAGAVHAAENPFALKPASGIVLADASKEGKCGEGKCGGKTKDAASAEKSAKEGKCGEGKCGADKKKADAQGKGSSNTSKEY